MTGRLLPALALLGAGVAAAAAAQEVSEDPSVLPVGPHRDEVFYLCTACHSSRLVRNQAMTRERWDETLTWMTERHGMPELVGEERERVLDYLSTRLGPESRDGARRSPFNAPPAQRRNPFAPG